MSRVPHIFHFVFGLRPQTEPFHLSHYLCLASCIEVNRPDKVYLHYRHMPYGYWWERIRQSLVLNPVGTDDFIERFRYPDAAMEKYRYAHLADAVRLQVLLEYGGIYADIDTLFVRPLPETFFRMPAVMGQEKVDWSVPAAREAGGSLCNAWIMAEPGARFVRRWLDRLPGAFDGTWSAHSTFLPYKLSREHREDIHVEPERSFFYFDWSANGIRNLFERECAAPDGVYSIHLWSHLWWDKQRTTFTYFHHGRLTENYVAYAPATYSRMAGRYLPGDVPVSREAYGEERKRQQLENVVIFCRQTGKRLLDIF